MAKGADSEEFVVLSSVRAGLKREFAFAFKSRSEIGDSLGRTRSRKASSAASSDNARAKRRSKRGEKVSITSEEETDSEVVDGNGGAWASNRRVGEFPRKGEMESGSLADSNKNDGTEDEDNAEEELRNEPFGKEFTEEDKPLAVEIGKIDSEKSSVDETEAIVTEMLLEDQPVKLFSEEISEKAVKPLIQFSRMRFGKRLVEKNCFTEQPTDHKPVNTMKIDFEEPIEVELEPLKARPKPSPDEEVAVHSGKLVKRFTRSALKPNPNMVKLVAEKDLSIEKAIGTCSSITSIITPPPKTTMNVFKSSKKFPSKLQELLNSGLLEGQRVTYIKGPKSREPNESRLQGAIKGSGILCHCGSCKGTEVITPVAFEQHAGSTNKRPPEYIYLDSGNTLRDVLNALQRSTLSSLEETVHRVIGESAGKCSVCFQCKGSISEAGSGKSTFLCYSCVDLAESLPKRVVTPDCKNSDVLSLKCIKSPKPCFTPKLSESVQKCKSVLKSKSAPKCSSSQSKSQGRITRKDNRLNKLVFEEDILPDGTEVAYYARGQKLLVGYKKGSGIICSCCNSEVSPSQFEAHAGWASRRKPYLHIYTSNGVSLHELAISLSRNQKFSTYTNDDLCFVCQNGGDLVCCNGCPRAFHGSCINLPSSETNNANWYCKVCQSLYDKERYVQHNANAVAAGRVKGVDSIEQITNRCIRVMNTEEIDFGGCALCRSHEFSKSEFGPLTVLFCDQCEKEFHIGCMKDHGLQDLKELPDGMWFCCTDCQNINDALQKSVVLGEQKLSETLLDIIKQKQEQEGLEIGAEVDIKWRIVNRKLASNEETESQLSKAVAIFHDRFAPINDSATRRDWIPEMLFGNSIMGQDFSRMYCAILTVNQCVVSAGIFRIYGSEFAELPLVATSVEHERQGYFQALFSCVEGFLSVLKVRNLVLPSAEEAESIWIKKFGFNKLAMDKLNEYKRQYQMMIFQGTSVLSKTVPEN